MARIIDVSGAPEAFGQACARALAEAVAFEDELDQKFAADQRVQALRESLGEPAKVVGEHCDRSAS